MKNIIKNLDSKLLNSWGFEFTGSYWSHKNYEFRLQKKGDSYVLLVHTLQGDTVAPGQLYTNGQLLSVICTEFSRYFDKNIKKCNALNNEGKAKYISMMISEYFSFDKGLEFVLNVQQNGTAGLVPVNEYTYTMVSNIECTFRVSTKNNVGELSVVEDEIYYNPMCISLEFLQSLYPGKDIEKVEILKRDGQWETYYGMGIPKLHNSTKEVN